MGSDTQSFLEHSPGYVESISFHRLGSIGHHVPEVGSSHRVFDNTFFETVLYSTSEVVDGIGEVLLLHAKKTHPRSRAAVRRILIQDRSEAVLRIVQVMRIERGISGALGRRAANAGVHLRQL